MAILTGFIMKNLNTKAKITNHKKMKVEIWSDVMCPFCYIGKRRFEEALSDFEHANEIEVIWKSFQLNPNAVTNPNINVLEDLAQKKGWSMEYTRKMTESVVSMAESEGLEYNFEKAVSANSFNAHRLLQYAKTKGKGNELKEKLLAAYFTEGKNTDDDQTLITLGISIGLEKQAVTNVVNNKSAYADRVKADVQRARELQIRGVPFFLFNGNMGISGAQDIDSFKKGLRKSYKKWKKDQLENANSIAETIEGPVCTPKGECK